MPTSNGQVGRYDIRREAVHTDHIVDEAVATAKIPDLAVTFPDKIDDPIWVYSDSASLFVNATITTTESSFGDLSFDVPAWVDAVTITAIGHFQLSNNSGGTINMQAVVEIDEDSVGAYSHSVTNNQTQLMTPTRVRSLIGVAGSTITCSLVVSVNSGSNTSNVGRMRVIVVGTR